MKNTNQLIGCCGLDCERCDARIATVTNDNALREKTAALWTRLNGVPITPDMTHCTGCRVEGAKTPFCDKLQNRRIHKDAAIFYARFRDFFSCQGGSTLL
jgi:hypothetical protein